MKNWLAKQPWGYRFQQFLILLAHLILLKWILYTLGESGVMLTSHVLLHFLGMAIYGALLIRGTAYWAQYHHQKELRQYEQDSEKKGDNKDD